MLQVIECADCSALPSHAASSACDDSGGRQAAVLSQAMHVRRTRRPKFVCAGSRACANSSERVASSRAQASGMDPTCLSQSAQRTQLEFTSPFHHSSANAQHCGYQLKFVCRTSARAGREGARAGATRARRRACCEAAAAVPPIRSRRSAGCIHRKLTRELVTGAT